MRHFALGALPFRLRVRRYTERHKLFIRFIIKKLIVVMQEINKKVITLFVFSVLAVFPIRFQ